MRDHHADFFAEQLVELRVNGEGADVVVQPDEGRLEALSGGHVHAAQAHPEGIHQRQQHEAQEADDEGQNEQIAGYCSARTNGNAFAAHLLTSCCAA